MTNSLPEKIGEFMAWDWAQIEPFYRELSAFPISEKNVEGWLLNWTHLKDCLDETYWRLYVAITINTADQDASQRYANFLDSVRPAAEAADQELKLKLLSSGLNPPGLEIPLRNLRTETTLFRQANLPLLSNELKLSSRYDQLIGAQTVIWEGKEIPIPQLLPVYLRPERSLREKAWRLASERQLADRETINRLWQEVFALRKQIAANNGLASFRAYRWLQLLRLDYTPEDCLHFHAAIREVAVPASRRIYALRRQRLGLDRLRPWDLDVDPFGRPPLHPFDSIEELKGKTANIFQQLDPSFKNYFEIMRTDGLLDLENRKDKAPGGYCTDFRHSNRAFIFANSVGIHDDVQTLLHEGGHAFHCFETNALPYHFQKKAPMEFNEVASTSLEYMGGPFLGSSQGGFYSTRDAARAVIETLERAILFWPYMAVVDAFQHWAYENPGQALNPEACDSRWEDLWDEYMVEVDWSGLEQSKVTGWQRKPHIMDDPFYYVEYGLAQVGAGLVWMNFLKDRSGAVAAYRKALSLGYTVSLPELYTAAGADLSFGADTLRKVIDHMEATIDQYET